MECMLGSSSIIKTDNKIRVQKNNTQGLQMNTKLMASTALIVSMTVAPLVANATTPTSGTPVMGPNGNYYEVVVAPGVDWDTADTTARELTFNGIVGHLATITSEPEDNFIHVERMKLFTKEAWVGGFQDLEAVCAGSIPAKQCGWTWINGEGSFPGSNSAAPYANWTSGEPNDAGGAESYLGVGHTNVQSWNDEANENNIGGYVVEYDFVSVYVPPGPDQEFLDGANDPASPHGVSAAYQEVLEGGNASINCCTVVDWREGAGGSWWHGRYLPTDFDLGTAIDSTPGCEALRVYDDGMFGTGKAILQPWLRGIPRREGIPSNTFEMGANSKNDIGVCLIQSDVVSKGVVFTEEETSSVLGYSINCSERFVYHRPFTGGVAIDPTEIDAPNVTRWSADCDRSRSGKRSSDNLMVMNLWHYQGSKRTTPYLKGLATALKDSIEIERTRFPACVDNSEGFLDELTTYVTYARRNMGWWRSNPRSAVRALDDATRLAMYIDTGPREIPLPSSDPYLSTPSCDANNAKGLLVGRLLALKFATCSERLRPWGSSSSSGSDPQCVIEPDIFEALPPLPPPGF